MATFSKTQGTSLVSFAEITSGNVTVGSASDVSTKGGATVFMRFGRCAATALTKPFSARIEIAHASSGDTPMIWTPIYEAQSSVAAAADEAVSGTCSSGQAVVGMASTTGFAVDPNDYGKLVFIRNSTPANSEWGRVKTVTSNTSVTLEEVLTNAQTGSTVYGAAFLWVAQIDLSAVGRLRVVADNSATGQTVAFRADMVTFDSFG